MCAVDLQLMGRKFLKHVPKGASRRKSLKKEDAAGNKEDSELSNDKSVQCDLLGAPENKESAERSETISERPVMCDASCQTNCDMTDDEPADAAVVVEPENLCEGNPDAKFHPLILKHQGVFTNLQGMHRLFMIITLMFHFLPNRIISGSLL